MAPRATRRWWFGLCTMLAVGLGLCEAAVLRANDRPEQVLVFHTGRIVKGWISRSPSGYVVEHAAGRLVVPYDETRVIGDDLPDAYRRLRETFVNPTAATHYELALWCSAHQMQTQARDELVMALDRDPEHESARDLLTRMDAQEKAARQREVAKHVKLPARIVNGIEIPEAESLAGLSRETATAYTTRIQPLLLNKCGNAGCHGPNASQDFKLESTRGAGPGHRVYSERNLAMVLDQIDAAKPAQSRLLQVGTAAHGGLNRALFFGPTGERQLQLLRNWVRVAAKETARETRVAADQNRIAPKQPVFPKDDRPIRAVAAHDDELNPRGSMASVTEPAAAAAEQPILDDQPDAFDPEVFNRRYHGTKSKPHAKATKKK